MPAKGLKSPASAAIRRYLSCIAAAAAREELSTALGALEAGQGAFVGCRVLMDAQQRGRQVRNRARGRIQGSVGRSLKGELLC